MKGLFVMALTAAAMAAGASASDVEFAYGADVSWMTWQEQCGIKFYEDDETTETDVESLLESHGFNAARLRVWVNPENYANDSSEPTQGHCTTADVVEKAKRLAAKGQRIMLCFHFSDTWADPAKQRIPKAWQDYYKDLDKLTALAVNHVADVCQAVKDAGIDVTWVQIGNEDALGFMLQAWDGSANLSGGLTWANYTNPTGYISVWNACAAKARDIFPAVKTVHHLASGESLTYQLTYLNYVLTASQPIDVDYIGVSIYPQDGDDTTSWPTKAEACIANIKTINAKYGVRTLIVETGMANDWSSATTGTSNQKNHTDQCNKDITEFAEYLIGMARRSGICDGVFYWEPQSSKTSYATSAGVDGTGGYSWGAMMDVERNSMTWGSRTKLCPNAYWTTVARLAAGYEPDLLEDEEVELADWNLTYSLDDRNTWSTLPFTQSSDGLWRLTGLNDDLAPYCLNYRITDRYEDHSYIASEAVVMGKTYQLYSTLDGTYSGWDGWLSGKWLKTQNCWTFDADALTLVIEETDSRLGTINVIDADASAVYYTLQGMQIDNPIAGQLYIERRGNVTRKKVY